MQPPSVERLADGAAEGAVFGASREERLRSVLVALVLALACVAIGTALAPGDTGDFWFFADRVNDLFGESGLRLYADHANTQTGPLALLLVGAIDAVDPGGFVLVPIVAAVLCGFTLVALWHLHGRHRRLTVMLVGGLVLTAWWWFLAWYGHLDDASVLTITAVALVLVQRDRRLPAAVLVGVALAIKPWSVFLVPLTLHRDAGGTRSVVPPALSLAVGVLCWGPFLLAAPAGTLDGVRPTVRVSGDSVLQLFGMSPGDEAPAALRLAQLAIAFALVTWLVWRGHPAAALLGGVAARIAIDAGTWEYYTVGLVLGALMWDVEESDRRPPWATLGVSVLVLPYRWFVADDLCAVLRLLGCVGSIGLVVRTARSRHYSAAVREPMNSCARRPSSRDRRRGGVGGRRRSVGDTVRPVPYR